MVDVKLRNAFRKVKQDVFALAKDIDRINNSLKDLKSGFTIVSDVNSDVKNLSKELKEQNNLVKSFDDKFDGFKKLIEKKISEEVAKLEFKIKTEFSRPNEGLNDTLELIQEKVSLEVSSLKIEVMDEIAQLRDKFYMELLVLKEDRGRLMDELQEDKKKKVVEKSVKEVKNTELDEETDKKGKKNKKEEKSKGLKEEKEGMLKRFSKWLFIDCEDDAEGSDFIDIKDEVGSEKDTKKEVKTTVKKDSVSKKKSKE